MNQIAVQMQGRPADVSLTAELKSSDDKAKHCQAVWDSQNELQHISKKLNTSL